jgi:hypothetical protein
MSSKSNYMKILGSVTSKFGNWKKLKCFMICKSIIFIRKDCISFLLGRQQSSKFYLTPFLELVRSLLPTIPSKDKRRMLFLMKLDFFSEAKLIQRKVLVDLAEVFNNRFFGVETLVSKIGVGTLEEHVLKLQSKFSLFL